MGDELIGQAQGGIAIEGPDPIENEAVGLVDLEGADRFGEGVDDLTEGEALDDVIDPLIAEDQAERLATLEDEYN